MAVSTSTAPELTAEQVQKILVSPLETASQFLACSPRIFDSANQIRIPKMGAATSPAWHGENEQITEQDVTFDEIVLLPSTMESVKVLTRYSNELARQSVVSLDAALKDRLVRDVAAKIDAQLFAATGDGITLPKGILAYSGVQSIDKAGAALDARRPARRLGPRPGRQRRHERAPLGHAPASPSPISARSRTCRTATSSSPTRPRTASSASSVRP